MEAHTQPQAAVALPIKKDTLEANGERLDSVEKRTCIALARYQSTDSTFMKFVTGRGGSTQEMGKQTY
jgi:hypothetical protein